MFRSEKEKKRLRKEYKENGLIFPAMIINKATGVIFSVNEMGYDNYCIESEACKLATNDEVLELVRVNKKG